MPKIIVLDKDDRWNRSAEDEFLWWPRTLWIDPGVVSGVAVVWFDPKALLVDEKPTAKVVLAYSELFLRGPENVQVKQFLQLHDKLDEEVGLATGSESFVPRQLNMDKDFLSPARLRAVIDYELWRKRNLSASVGRDGGEGVPLYTQAPVDAMNAFTNDRLKALHMYTPGSEDHANDAKRHCLLHVRRLKGHGTDSLNMFKLMHGYEEGWFE